MIPHAYRKTLVGNLSVVLGRVGRLIYAVSLHHFVFGCPDLRRDRTTSLSH